MARVLPLTFRRAAYAPYSEDRPIVLLEATHPDLVDGPIRVSSDPTVRLSADPLVYGTTSNGDDYLFVLMTAIFPGEDEESTPALRLILEDVESKVSEILRSFQTPATITLSLVSSLDPDTVLEQYTDLQTVTAQGNAAQVQIDISREPFIAEPSPAGRFTKQYFPGLHR